MRKEYFMKLIGYVIKNEPDIERYKNLAKKIYKTNIENLILENYRSSHFKC